MMLRMLLFILLFLTLAVSRAAGYAAGSKSPNRLFSGIRKKIDKSEKITAAVLAFPLPFGIVGLHRIYFGTKPYVPVAYIATLGGCFGILPLVDFFEIIFEKDLSPFENNPRVFMWAK
jgi:hypothetical protein